MSKSTNNEEKYNMDKQIDNSKGPLPGVIVTGATFDILTVTRSQWSNQDVADFIARGAIFTDGDGTPTTWKPMAGSPTARVGCTVH